MGERALVKTWKTLAMQSANPYEIALNVVKRKKPVNVKQLAAETRDRSKKA